MDTQPRPSGKLLSDPLGRRITYLRLSVTDRCDLRCTYCMDEHFTFVPRRELLSLEELDRLAAAFVALGVSKIRLTGGEPLVRKGVMWLMERLSRHLAGGGLRELTMTSNGTRLDKFAPRLFELGLRRVNISLDTRDSEKFRQISRIGDLSKVLAGIKAAQAAGIRVKLNMVAIRGFNEDEIIPMLEWAHDKGMDLTLIEVMPFGDGARWLPSLLPLDEVRTQLAARFHLEELADNTGGPARYVRVKETGGKLGFITPLSGNFCEGCNRVRVTCRGRLYQCLGREQYVDLRAVLQAHGQDDELHAAIHRAIAAKPEGHDFEQRRQCGSPRASRPMSSTGG